MPFFKKSSSAKSPEAKRRTQRTNGDISELLETMKSYDLEEVEKAVRIIRESKVSDSPNTEQKIEQQEEPFDESNVSDELKAQAMKLFRATDQNQSGTIEEEELNALLTQLYGRPVTLPETNLLYHEMDRNKSGTITYDEFLAALLKYKWDASKVKTETKKETDFQWEIDQEELEKENKLGEGGYGVCYKAKWRGLGVVVKELKEVRSLKPENINDFKQEISIMAKLRHPNVLLFMGASTDLEHLTIVTEYMDGGDLQELFVDKKADVGIRKILDFAKQTAVGMNYLHLSKMIHRDLKLANLLIDKSGNLKICDFGLACVKGDTPERRRCGTPVWMAPEVLRPTKDGYDEKVDVYAFALCCWGMFSREDSYAHIKTLKQLIEEVCLKSQRPKPFPISCPLSMQHLIRLCWHPSPKKRPNFAQIIGHLEKIEKSLS